jgi:hypothetical protein
MLASTYRIVLVWLVSGETGALDHSIILEPVWGGGPDSPTIPVNFMIYTDSTLFECSVQRPRIFEECTTPQLAIRPLQ